MKCPYCAEEIKDEAKVCRYCRQDLVLYKQLLEKLFILEKQILETADPLRNLQSTPKPSKENPLRKEKNIFPSLNHRMAILLPIILSFGTFFLIDYLDHFHSSYTELLFIIMFLSPLLFGLWLGVSTPGENFKTFVRLGFIIGMITALGLLIGTYITSHTYNYPDTKDIFGFFVLFGGGATLLFTTGGLIGDWIERIRFSKPRKEGYSERIARNLGKKMSDEDIKRLANIIGAIAPLLTITASILTAYLGSQAGLLALTPSFTTDTIYVETTPPNASIFLDGNYHGKTPNTIKDVKEGDHSIILKLSGYETIFDTIHQRAGASSAFIESFKPLKSYEEPIEPTLPGDAILHYRIVNKSKTNLTIEVIYEYNIHHGEKVYIGAHLLGYRYEIGTKSYASQVPTVGNGTATVELDLKTVELDLKNKSIESPNEIKIYMFEKYKEEPFVTRIFPFKVKWEPEPITLSIDFNPLIISPGDSSEVNVTALYYDLSVPDLFVSIEGDGGYFSDTGTTIVTGHTNNNGVFSTTWSTYNKSAYSCPGQVGYMFNVKGWKKGYVMSYPYKGNLTIKC